MKRLESVKLVQFLLYEQQEFRLEEITGLFGRNGSGKSSALDAVQIAMMGANKNLMHFNAQADAKSHQSRTLRSYCLGQYGDTIEQCARPQATTYVTLVWRDTETNEPVSMGVCIEASLGNEAEKVLGRYVIRGVELTMSEHLQTVDGTTMPLPWSSFRHRLLEQSKVTGEEPLFDDGASYVKQVLFMLRGKAGPASYDAFARAFRFALRMSFSKSVDQIVRQDVLEDRPTNIQKFRAIVDSFKAIKGKIEWVQKKIAASKEVAASFAGALVEARRSATWGALSASADHERVNADNEALCAEQQAAVDKASQTIKDSEKAAQDLSDLDERIAHLQRLQEAHSDHRNSVQDAQDREAAQSRLNGRSNGYTGELATLLRLVNNAGKNELAKDWTLELQACAQRLEAAAKRDGQEGDFEFLQRVLRDLGAVATKAEKALGHQHQEAKAAADATADEVKLAADAVERLRGGHARISDQTQYLINELRDNGLNPQPVCDLVRVTDPEWQPAIEAYLASNVEALLLPEGEEEQAFQIYRGLQGRRAIYGVKIVRASRLRTNTAVQDDMVAALIEGKNQHAVGYLRSKLGALKRADSGKDALRGERTLTVDGMLTGPGDFERLRLVPHGGFRIGGADTSALPGLMKELLRLQQIHRQQTGLVADLFSLRASMQGMASQQTARLIERSFEMLREAHNDMQVISQRLIASASAEYLDLTNELSKRQKDRPDADQKRLDAHTAAKLAEQAEKALSERCAASTQALQASAANLELRRADTDLVPDYYSDQWDKLLERFADNYVDMASHSRRQADLCAAAMNRHISAAQKSLGAYLTEYREAVSDEISADWRKTKAWMDHSIQRLEATELAEYEAEAEKAYETAQLTFRQDVAVALSSNLRFMRETFERLNKALRSTPAFTNGERYQFIYRMRPDLEPLLKFVNNVADFGVDGNLFGDPGSIPELFNDLLRDKMTTGNGAVKSPLDDYREFYEFDIRIDTEDAQTGTSKRVGHLSKRVGPGSGGEHRAPLYVIAGAALSSAYRMDENNQDGLRLMLLDEAFDKMDPSNIVATMRYLEKLGLQVLLASPGENLPTLTAFLHRYFEIMKDETRHVIQVEEHKVSEAMREQFREDMWEYHPELLEAELLAVRQEPIARPAAATP